MSIASRRRCPPIVVSLGLALGLSEASLRAEPLVSRFQPLPFPGVATEEHRFVQAPESEPLIEFGPLGDFEGRRQRQPKRRASQHADSADRESVIEACANRMALLVMVGYLNPSMKFALRMPPPPPPPRALLNPPRFIAVEYKACISPPTVTHTPEPAGALSAAVGVGLAGVFCLWRRMGRARNGKPGL